MGETRQVRPAPTWRLRGGEMAVLKLGSTGPEVANLQDRLRDLGFAPGPTDSSFGPTTEAAVIAFQTSMGLVADGVVGPLTAAALAPSTPPITGAPAAPS